MHPILKRSIVIISSRLLVIIAFFCIQNYPFAAAATPGAMHADSNYVKQYLSLITQTAKPRNYKNTDVLDSVASHIHHAFHQSTSNTGFQHFAVNGNNYKNVIASFGPENAERIIVGAHYDVCGDQQGADDNASGVAGILELARLLKNTPLQYRIDLVAYTLEEPPFFATQYMGSYIHAKSLHDADVPVLGMIDLEMIGYYSDSAHSQTYPVGPLSWVYGNKGNFITIVQKSAAGNFAKTFRRLAFKNSALPVKSFKAPSFLGGIDLSDHRNYWQFGYSAVMVTNTSFYRNQNYHLKTDVAATLDIHRMTLAIETVYRTILALNR